MSDTETTDAFFGGSSQDPLQQPTEDTTNFASASTEVFTDVSTHQEDVVPELPPLHKEPASEEVPLQQVLFEFTVHEPERHEKQKTLDVPYWTYKIDAATTLPQYANSNLTVKRRYNDFSWLREKLIERHTGCVVPPIPEKSIMGTVEKVLGIDAKDLIDYRQRSLLKFLTRVGAHPVLAQSEVLQKFLELDEVEFAKMKDAKTQKASSSFGQKLRELSFSVTAKTKSAELEWIEKQTNIITVFENILKTLKDRLQDMVRKRKELSVAVTEFGKAFDKLGELEKLNAGSASDGRDVNSTNNGTILGSNLSLVAQKATEFGSSLISQADTETLQVVETLMYYVGMNEAVKGVLKKLESLVTSRDTLRNMLEAKRQEREKLSQQAGKEEKIKKLDTEIEDLLTREQAADSDYQKADEVFKRDYAAFEATRYIDFNVMVNSFITLQIEYSEKTTASWQQIMPK